MNFIWCGVAAEKAKEYSELKLLSLTPAPNPWKPQYIEVEVEAEE